MAYMSRLGIWGRGTQFPEFQDFIKSVERRGVGAMEIVAMDMKVWPHLRFNIIASSYDLISVLVSPLS